MVLVEGGEGRQFDHGAPDPSNSTGSTMMLEGGAAPSPELTRT